MLDKIGIALKFGLRAVIPEERRVITIKINSEIHQIRPRKNSSVEYALTNKEKQND